jgi:2-polyprenyl-3-methyl-5-hydroxy-6-metoxy-1,4-benzoquinol methylase
MGPAAVEVARKQGVDAHVCVGGVGVNAASSIGKKYDFIALGHMVEHLHDPAEAIIQCKKLLKPSGRIWIDTPNIDSFGHDI